MSAAEFEVDPEVIAKMEDVLKDKARQQLLAEIGCRIERVHTLLECSNFVCVRSTRTDSDPFFIGEVYKNYAQEQKLIISWYEPSLLSKERGNQYHKYCFKEQLIAERNSRNNNGTGGHLKPFRQEIDYACVHFGFSRLLRTGGLPAQVLRELRDLGLVKGPIKRHL
jgi:hypothetical protein